MRGYDAFPRLTKNQARIRTTITMIAMIESEFIGNSPRGDVKASGLYTQRRRKCKLHKERLAISGQQSAISRRPSVRTNTNSKADCRLLTAHLGVRYCLINSHVFCHSHFEYTLS